jgi:secreted trypsin-like serine protease
MLNSDTLLTAAHCSILDVSSFRVYLHRHDLSVAPEAEGAVVYSVDKMIRHPEYVDDDSYLINDVAIWKLKLLSGDPLSLDNPSIKFDDGLLAQPNTLLTVAGWGTVSFRGPHSLQLMEVQIPTLSDDICKTAYEKVNTAASFCAGFLDGTKDSCQSDSGSPIFVQTPAGDVTIAGIVSYGEGCATPGKPGVYTRISHPQILEFITNTVNTTFSE